MTPLSMYELAMGDRFSSLALPIQRFHRLRGTHVLHGWVVVEAPASFGAKLLAQLLGTPTRTHSGPIQFDLQASPSEEIWTRRFPHQTMTSTLTIRGDSIVEHLGAARLTFELEATHGKLSMRLKAMRFFGVPCPAWLRPLVLAEERGSDDRFHFQINATVPFIGRVATYRGHLEIPIEESP